MTLDQDRLSRDCEVITLVQTLPKNRPFYTKAEKNCFFFFGVGYWGIRVQQVYPKIPRSPLKQIQCWISILQLSTVVEKPSNPLSFYSYCNLTHSEVPFMKKDLVRKTLPDLFQGHLLCAGTNTDNQGSCK